MSTEERNSRDKDKNQDTNKQKSWDEQPGQRDSDPKEQQRQREWEEAQIHQEQYAERPGVDKSDLKQHDNQGNPTDRGEDFQAEE